MQEGNFWKDVEGSENHWGAGESDLENRTTKEAGESWTEGTTAEAGVHWGLSITGCEGRSGGWEGAPHSQSPVPAPLAVLRWGQGSCPFQLPEWLEVLPPQCPRTMAK